MEALILTEGGSRYGFGHVCRCIALCEAFSEQGITPTLCVLGDEVVKKMADCFFCKLIDWRETDPWLDQKIAAADVVVIDSYEARAEDYRRIAERAKLAVFMDDNKRLDYPKGVIINMAIDADKLYAQKNPERDYLLGNAFVLLRKSVLSAREISSGPVNEPTRLFVSFGGGDSARLSVRIIDLLEKNKYFTLKIAIVVSCPSDGDEWLRRLGSARVTILYRPAQEELAMAMSSCDLAISAAGMTLYELAYLQKSTIAIAVAENQEKGLQAMVDKGFVCNVLDWRDPDLMTQLEAVLDFHIKNYGHVCATYAGRGRSLVDNQGGWRIVAAIKKKIDASILK